MSFVDEGLQTSVSFSTVYLIFLRRIWWGADVVFSKVIGPTSQNSCKTSSSSRLHNSNDSWTWCPLISSLLHICPFSHRLSPLFCELELKSLATTSLTLLTNTSCHISSPSSSPCELCFSWKPLTECVLCFDSVPTSGALEGSDGCVSRSAAKHNRGYKLVNQCCCSLSQIACYCLSVSAICNCVVPSPGTQRGHSINLNHSLSSSSQQKYTSLKLFMYRWYQFLISLAMRSHAKPVEVSGCLSALVCCSCAYRCFILAEPFSLWGYCCYCRVLGETFFPFTVLCG